MKSSEEVIIYRDADLVVHSVKKIEQCESYEPLGEECHKCDYSCNRDTEGIVYRVSDISKEDGGGYNTMLKFQRGNPLDDSVNGLTNESLLAILLHRLKNLNAKVSCEENIRALFYMEKAMKAFEDRSRDRQVRKIEGTNTP